MHYVGHSDEERDIPSCQWVAGQLYPMDVRHERTLSNANGLKTTVMYGMKLYLLNTDGLRATRHGLRAKVATVFTTIEGVSYFLSNTKVHANKKKVNNKLKFRK